MLIYLWDATLGEGFGSFGTPSRNSSFDVNADWNPFDYQNAELKKEEQESMRLADGVNHGAYNVRELEEKYDHPFGGGVTNESASDELNALADKAPGKGLSSYTQELEAWVEALEKAINDYERYWNERPQVRKPGFTL